MDEPDKRSNKLRTVAFFSLCGVILGSAIGVAIFGEPAGSDRVGGAATAPTAVVGTVGDEAAAFDPAAGPRFDVVRISRGGTGVIAGRAQPGSLVEVFADSRLVGSVRADERGEWVMILDEPLASGPAELRLLATPEDGQPNESGDVVVVAVPERDDERFLDRPGEGVVAVLTPREGAGPSRVLQKPGVATPGEVGDSLTIDTVDYGEATGTIVAGRALPRAEVRTYLDNGFVGSARASDDGRWSLTLGTELAPGEHVLRVDQVTGDDVELRIEQPFSTGAPLDTTLAQSRVVVRPGNTLWHISRRLYGTGFRYTVIFRENSEQIRDPDLIYPGQLFRLPQQLTQNTPAPAE